MKKTFWYKLTLVPVALILDQLVKRWVEENIPLFEVQKLLPGIVQLTHVENRGSAFGMLQNARWFFVGITIVAFGFLVWVLASKRIHGALGQWAVAFVISGALGNFIDRVRQGYVVDMFEFEFVSFAIFNVADIFITVGGVLACVYVLFFHERLTTAHRIASETAAQTAEALPEEKT